ncbi:MAG: hypothetical protein WCI39_13950 [Gallionellaceae bacterium]
MKTQHTPPLPTLVLVSSNHDVTLEMTLPSSPKMRQIMADYAAAHSVELREEPCRADQQKYH